MSPATSQPYSCIKVWSNLHENLCILVISGFEDMIKKWDQNFKYGTFGNALTTSGSGQKQANFRWFPETVQNRDFEGWLFKQECHSCASKTGNAATCVGQWTPAKEAGNNKTISKMPDWQSRPQTWSWCLKKQRPLDNCRKACRHTAGFQRPPPTYNQQRGTCKTLGKAKVQTCCAKFSALLILIDYSVGFWQIAESAIGRSVSKNGAIEYNFWVFRQCKGIFLRQPALRTAFKAVRRAWTQKHVRDLDGQHGCGNWALGSENGKTNCSKMGCRAFSIHKPLPQWPLTCQAVVSVNGAWQIWCWLREVRRWWNRCLPSRSPPSHGICEFWRVPAPVFLHCCSCTGQGSQKNCCVFLWGRAAAQRPSPLEDETQTGMFYAVLNHILTGADGPYPTFFLILGWLGEGGGGLVFLNTKSGRTIDFLYIMIQQFEIGDICFGMEAAYCMGTAHMACQSCGCPDPSKEYWALQTN